MPTRKNMYGNNSRKTRRKKINQIGGTNNIDIIEIIQNIKKKHTECMKTKSKIVKETSDALDAVIKYIRNMRKKTMRKNDVALITNPNTKRQNTIVSTLKLGANCKQDSECKSRRCRRVNKATIGKCSQPEMKIR
uniref:Uncharacterized protein n=1 Tax=viral metagenome TaxID=1070528 RepID=A0A6C0JAH8_9ZZZZ